MTSSGQDDRWFNQIWRLALNAHASDLHLTSGQVPILRVRGKLQNIPDAACCPTLPWSGLTAYFKHTEAQALLLGHGQGEYDGALNHPQLGRARWNLARCDHGLCCVMRLIPSQLPSLAEAQLDAALAEKLMPSHGLLLITGATGSGKSSTLAALMQHYRHTKGGHILTLEDPIEFRYDTGPGRVSQREIGRDSAGFASALRGALRQDPDVILVGELRDRETARMALTAAETGHLVLSTLHTANAAGAIHRLLNLFPADEQALAQSLLSDTLIGVISQQLHWRDTHACVIREILIATPAVRHLIREHRLNQLDSVMQTGASVGMQTYAQAWQRSGQPP